MKKSVLVTVCVTLGLIATAAWAGGKTGAEVYADSAGRYAYGALGSARNSADAVQYIGCYVYAYSSGSEYVGCFARNAAGTYVSCVSSVPQIINTVRGLNENGYLYFTYDAGGTCSYVEARNVSYFPPLLP